MKSNFDFLRTTWSETYKRAKQSEELAFPDTRGSFMFARVALERLVKITFEQDFDLSARNKKVLFDYVEDSTFKSKISTRLLNQIHEVRQVGNDAIHYNRLNKRPAEIIQGLFNYSIWFYNTYDTDEYIADFDLNLMPRESSSKKITDEEFKEYKEKLELETNAIINDLKEKIDLLEIRNQDLQNQLLQLKDSSDREQRKIEQNQANNAKKQEYFNFTILNIGKKNNAALTAHFINFNYLEKPFHISLNSFGIKKLISINQEFFENKTLNTDSADDIKYLDFEELELNDSKVFDRLILELKKKFGFSKTDREYIDNGHYLIDDESFMSIWTFKRKIKSYTPNETEINSLEAIDLINSGVKTYISKPNHGKFRTIRLYPERELSNFYQ